MDAQTIFNPAPSRIVGQAVLQQQGVLTADRAQPGGGQGIQQSAGRRPRPSVTPPILYVADFGNNRVLAWKSASAIYQRRLRGSGDRPARSCFDVSRRAARRFEHRAHQPGRPCRGCEGQPLCDRRGQQPRAALSRAVRANQRLAGGGSDHRPAGSQQLFGQRRPDRAHRQHARARNGGGVFRAGLAFDAQGNLWVSDPGNNRVLRYPASELAAGASNQPAADLVLGQNDFSSTSLPTNLTRSGKNYLSQPAGLAFDPKGRLFIADSCEPRGGVCAAVCDRASERARDGRGEHAERSASEREHPRRGGQQQPRGPAAGGFLRWKQSIRGRHRQRPNPGLQSVRAMADRKAPHFRRRPRPSSGR